MKNLLWHAYVAAVRTYYRIKRRAKAFDVPVGDTTTTLKYYRLTSLRDKLEYLVGRLTDGQWREICRIATNDINGNKLWLGQHTSHRYVVDIMHTAYKLLIRGYRDGQYVR